MQHDRPDPAHRGLRSQRRSNCDRRLRLPRHRDLELAGAYIFGDFSNGKIWGLTESSGTWTRTQLLNSGKNMSAFGQDAAGELYVVDYSGSVFKITAQ